MKPISVYDDVPFPSYPHTMSHPARLATIAKLRGIKSAPLKSCRVLEIGCDSGGHLIPLAEMLPDSTFVGIDLSAVRVKIAEEHSAAIGLTNARFLVADVLDWNASEEPFDYILCHGVFSWTTDASRDKIFFLCRHLLSQHGIAYVNYNTYPGWHVQGMLRDMLWFHAGQREESAKRVGEARAMIDFLLAALPAQGNPYAALLRNELDGMRRNSDEFLFHAYLNVINTPFYLHSFVEYAAKFDLQYLGDADPEAMWAGSVSPQLEQRLQALAARRIRATNDSLSQVTDYEQYSDFVRFGMSRRSLLCRNAANLRAMPLPSDLDGTHLSAQLVEQTSPQGAAPGAATFATPTGRTLTATDQQLVASLRILGQAWPESRPIEWLESETTRQNDAEHQARNTETDRWRTHLVRCFAAGILDLSVRPSECSTTPGDHPRATQFARRQAATQTFVADLRHATARLNEFDRWLLQHLDGQHTESQLANMVTTTNNPREQLESVRQALGRLAAQALLRRQGS